VAVVWATAATAAEMVSMAFMGSAAPGWAVGCDLWIASYY
jgi:hypothetical protein